VQTDDLKTMARSIDLTDLSGADRPTSAAPADNGVAEATRTVPADTSLRLAKEAQLMDAVQELVQKITSGGRGGGQAPRDTAAQLPGGQWTASRRSSLAAISTTGTRDGGGSGSDEARAAWREREARLLRDEVEELGRALAGGRADDTAAATWVQRLKAQDLTATSDLDKVFTE